MPDSTNPKYVDHPAPSASLVFLLYLTLGVVLVAGSEAFRAGEGSLFFVATAAFVVLVVCFYFWPLYATYYTLSAEGLTVRYGPWHRLYPWSEFEVAYWQRGLFASRIGWPSITPCVRLTDGVLLRRKNKWFGLYLTPNDPRAFLRKVAEFAPDLTKEAIL